MIPGLPQPGRKQQRKPPPGLEEWRRQYGATYKSVAVWLPYDQTAIYTIELVSAEYHRRKDLWSERWSAYGLSEGGPFYIGHFERIGRASAHYRAARACEKHLDNWIEEIETNAPLQGVHPGLESNEYILYPRTRGE